MVEKESYFISALLRQIEAKIEAKISKFSDCKLLSNRLKEEGIHISAHTVARAFNILPSKHRPYPNTLDLLTKFIGVKTYGKFCKETEEQSKYALANPAKAFKTGPFSLTACEMALNNMDLEALRKLLDAYEKKYADFSFSNLLGSKVKYHKHRSRLLEFFGEFEKGRRLYYEGFVDEMDENNYFSKAVIEHYLPNVKRKQSKLFAELYLITQAIYQEDLSVLSKAEKIILVKSELLLLSPQLIGRYFELKILTEGAQKNRYKVVLSFVENLLEILPKVNEPFKSWILGKCIKALGHTNNLERVVLENDFKNAIVSLNESISYKMRDIGDLFVQLIAHKFYQKEVTSIPKKITDYPLNEEKTKILLEALTAEIYAPKVIKEILKKNIVASVSKSKKYNWANSFLD